MQRKAGFTLVELLIYSVIFASVSLTLTYFLSTFFRVSGYQASSSEIANQANFILGKIQNEVAISSLFAVNETGDDEIDGLPVGGKYSQLVLTSNTDGNNTPIKIYKNGTDIMLQRGASAATALNNASVAVTNLGFTKISTPPGKDVVIIDLSLQYQSPNAADRITRDFSLGVSRAQAATFDSDLTPNGSGRSIGSGSAKWASLSLSGAADIGGPVTIGNTANNSISFIKQGTVAVNPNATIAGNSVATVIVTAPAIPELTGIQTGDRVFLTPPSGILSPLENGLVFHSARALPDAIEIRIRNVTTGNITATTAHNWGYLVIR